MQIIAQYMNILPTSYWAEAGSLFILYNKNLKKPKNKVPNTTQSAVCRAIYHKRFFNKLCLSYFN
jgi:hypothetical protein